MDYDKFDDINNNKIDDIDIYLNHLSFWIFNIVEILRINYNKEYDLFNYFTNQRPKYLIKNDIDKIEKMNENEFINFITNKLSEITTTDSNNDNNNINKFKNILYNHRDSILFILNKFEFNGKQFINLSINELFNNFIEINNNEILINDENDIKQIINWFYSLIHDIQIIETPIFDQMMEKRQSLRNDLLSFDDDDNNMMMKEFNDLMKYVDDNDHNHKLKINDDEKEKEKEFVQLFLKNKGFEQHSEKFESMYNLSKMKTRELRKYELCAKHRKNLLCHINKWNELQNIIKFGDKPYYRSNGISKTSIPSKGQVIGGQKINNNLFNYSQFTNYPSLHQLIQKTYIS